MSEMIAISCILHNFLFAYTMQARRSITAWWGMDKQEMLDDIVNQGVAMSGRYPSI